MVTWDVTIGNTARYKNYEPPKKRHILYISL